MVMDYDVAVVGASVGGCTAAKLYAEAGARVALIERKPELDAYKKICTHYLQASAVPTLERLGLIEPLEAAGAIRNPIDIWTPVGFIRLPDDEPVGYSVRRVVLDPLLRRMTVDTPGVDYMPGRTVVGLLGNGRPSGVSVRTTDGSVSDVRARLVVAADGRGSGLGRMAGVRGRVLPHGRFFYYGYFRDLDWPAHPRSRMWILDPDAAYVFPNDDGVTVILVAPHKSRRAEFRADLEGSFARMVDSLPDGPRLEGAVREGSLLGKLDLPNILRPAARPGLAFVGDAALSCDPLWGVGCGWALQSADWLVSTTASSLDDRDALDRALVRYRRQHLARLAPHHLIISIMSRGRPSQPFDRFLWRAAARDEKVVREFGAVGSRLVSPARIFRPDVLGRAILANVRGAGAHG